MKLNFINLGMGEGKIGGPCCYYTHMVLGIRTDAQVHLQPEYIGNDYCPQLIMISYIIIINSCYNII